MRKQTRELRNVPLDSRDTKGAGGAPDFLTRKQEPATCALRALSWPHWTSGPRHPPGHILESMMLEAKMRPILSSLGADFAQRTFHPCLAAFKFLLHT